MCIESTIRASARVLIHQARASSLEMVGFTANATMKQYMQVVNIFYQEALLTENLHLSRKPFRDIQFHQYLG